MTLEHALAQLPLDTPRTIVKIDAEGAECDILHDVRPLDRVDAVGVGRLLAASSTADIADAHVVICARRAGQRVVTSDPSDLRRLDPGIELLEI